MLGRKVRCPGCNAAFVATAGAPAAPPLPPDNPFAVEPPHVPLPPAPAPPLWSSPPPQPLAAPPFEEIASPSVAPAPGGATRDDWQSIRAGLHLQIWAHALYLGALFLLLILLMIYLSQYSSPSPSSARFESGRSSKSSDDGKFMRFMVTSLSVLAVLALLANWIGSVVAGCLCMSAPTRHGARGYALAGLVLVGMVLLGSMDMMRDLSGASSDSRGRGSGPTGGFGTGAAEWIEIGRLAVLGWLLSGLSLNLQQRGMATTGAALGMLSVAILFGTRALFGMVIYFVEPKEPYVPVLLLALSFAGQMVILAFGIALMLRVQQAISQKTLSLARD
jgi:hypothetical protein